MKKLAITETHKFVNLENEKECKVITSTRVPNGGNLIVRFQGWNPFPCYQMETSWKVFTEWMANNNWIEINGILKIIHEVRENE